MLFRCFICGKDFQETRQLGIHLKRDHDTSQCREWRCAQGTCTSNCWSWTVLNTHLKAHGKQEHLFSNDAPHHVDVENACDFEPMDCGDTDTTSSDVETETDIPNLQLYKPSVWEQTMAAALEQIVPPDTTSDDVQTNEPIKQYDFAEAFVLVKNDLRLKGIRCVGRMRKNAKVPLTVVSENMQAMSDVVTTALDFAIEQITFLKDRAIVESDLVDELLRQFDDLKDPYNFLNEARKQDRFFKNQYPYFVQPKQLSLGLTTYGPTDKPKTAFWSFVDPRDQIKAILSGPGMAEKFKQFHLASLTELDSPVVTSYMSSENRKLHPIFGCRLKNGIPIELYMDDFEVCNPLGSKKTVHKVCGIYIRLVGVPPRFTSSIRSILLVGLAYSQDIKRFGVGAILDYLGSVFSAMEDNPIVVGGETFYPGLAYVSGDNLALNGMFGYMESFGRKMQFCRMCYVCGPPQEVKARREEEVRLAAEASAVVKAAKAAAKSDGIAYEKPVKEAKVVDPQDRLYELKFRESDFHPRTVESYAKDVACSKAALKEHCKTDTSYPLDVRISGVKRACELNGKLPGSFHAVTSYSVDAMHDALEVKFRYVFDLASFFRLNLDYMHHVAFSGVLQFALRMLLTVVVQPPAYTQNKLPPGCNVAPKQQLTFEKMNQIIHEFPYGRSDVTSKLLGLSKRDFGVSNGGKDLDVKAFQCYNLFRLLPLMLCNHVDTNSVFFQHFLDLRQIADMVFGHSWTTKKKEVFEDLFDAWMRRFVELYVDDSPFKATVYPKFHSFVHYGTASLKSGPVVHKMVQSLEIKHGWFKNCALASCNFMNILFTLAMKHQVASCAFDVGAEYCDSTSDFLGIRNARVSHAKIPTLARSCFSLNRPFDFAYRICITGQYYYSKQFIIHSRGVRNDVFKRYDPLLAEIVGAIIYDYKDLSQVYFLIHKHEHNFEKNLWSYAVLPKKEFALIPCLSLLHPHPLDAYTIKRGHSTKKYVTLRAEACSID